MTYLINYFIFEIFYISLYTLPMMLILTVIKAINLPELIILPITLIAFLVGLYRAKLAADSKVRGNLTFLQAHQTAGAILKTNLSFLPIIGFIFQNKEK